MSFVRLTQLDVDSPILIQPECIFWFRGTKAGGTRIHFMKGNGNATFDVKESPDAILAMLAQPGREPIKSAESDGGGPCLKCGGDRLMWSPDVCRECYCKIADEAIEKHDETKPSNDAALREAAKALMELIYELEGLCHKSCDCLECRIVNAAYAVSALLERGGAKS
jgi:hypothetical protein